MTAEKKMKLMIYLLSFLFL